MDFELSEELKMVQSLARDFVRDQVRPLERDLLGRSSDLGDARVSLPAETEQDLTNKAKEVGLWGIAIPEELGGGGMGVLETCLVEEELAQTVVPFSFGDVSPLLFECKGEQKVKYFAAAFDKKKSVYLALVNEQYTRRQVGGIQAEKRGAEFLLNGSITSFSRPGTDYFAVVFAATGSGTTCFLVDRGTPGFEVTGGEVYSDNGQPHHKPLRLSFANCLVLKDNILGEEEQAFSLGSKWLPSRRIVRGARSVGVSQRLLEEATTRAQTWESFGKPVAVQPGVQAALAEIAISVHVCRLLVYEAAWKVDRGDNVRREASMVKLFAATTLSAVADRVAHIYGAPPYIAGLPMERLCRDALATDATDLAMELQRNIIARDILKGLRV